MRAFRLFPKPIINAAHLSTDAIKRLSWIDWYFSHGRNASLICRYFGISRDTFYRWLKRFNRSNLKSLEFDTKTRRPHHVREMTTPQSVRERIYEIRLNDLEKSKYEIQAELKEEGIFVGQTTIQKVINRNEVLKNSLYRKKMRTYHNYRIARIKAERGLREKEVGSLVQVDTKYFSVLGDRYYLFSAVDCKSRFGFVYAYTTISSSSAKDFIGRVREYFPFPIKAINTDNGSEYLLQFHKELETQCIQHYFIDPHCPKQNGRVERFHQTVAYEYLYHQDLYPGLEFLRSHLMKFNDKYNTKRYHRSLGYKTPLQAVLEYKHLKGGRLYGI